MVFILNFFLLSSAQFIKIFEIGSDLPIYQLTTDDNPKDKELELELDIRGDGKILVKNNVNQGLLGSFSYLDSAKLDEFKQFIKKIKTQYEDENQVVVKSASSVLYQDLVSVLDVVREERVEGQTVKLFNQIIFDGK